MVGWWWGQRRQGDAVLAQATSEGGAAAAASRALRAQHEDFASLKLLTRLFAAAADGDSAEVLRYVRDLPYIPLDRTRVQAAEEDFRRRAASSSALTKSVPALVVAAAAALAAALKEAQGRERAQV
jgi:hypothetical protein